MVNGFRLPVVNKKCTHISAYIAGQLNIFYELSQKFVHIPQSTFFMLWRLAP